MTAPDDLIDNDLPPPQKRRGEERPEFDLLGTEPQTRDTMSASALQSWASCALRGRFMIRGGARELTSSSYARDLQADGKQFEEQLVETPRIWQRLIKSAFGVDVPGPMIRLESPSGATESDYESNIELLQETTRSPEPKIFYQVGIYRETPGEQEIEQGAIDMIFWDGARFRLGEIKLTDTPKEQTAYQLLYYREFLEKSGIEVSPEAFVLHSNTGWRYDRKRGEQKRRSYLVNTRLTKFSLDHNLEAYRELMAGIDGFRKSGEPACCVELATLKPACPECKFRLECYEIFKKESADPRLDKAGLEESFIEQLAENGIRTVREALTRLDDLEELHGGHPERVKDMRRRLETTLRLGGFSTWIPPMRMDKTPVPAEEVVFFASRLWWTLADPTPQETPPNGQSVTLVVFTDKEAEPARIAYRKINPGARTIPVILENEVGLTVTLPFPNLTLRGIANTLEGVVELGSWETYARTQMDADHEWVRTKESGGGDLEDGAQNQEAYRRERASNVMRVYNNLCKLHDMIVSDGRRL